ncbi:MAG TPA: neutral/alkaline non-lysosomal ceramidase N-terminal domain-containing protein [Dehalococcoidia bacterium]|nr:neutral/alkaline non-lysosomal ceramidase N-terminal domain-containing protein [Dehalococcoidia bacterium]
MTLRAGAAEVVMTPPIGTPLDGYGGRVGGAVGVHDDLHARAIVVDDGATQAAIVGCDLVGVDRRLVAMVRERATAATGIPSGNIMVAATHTHAGPAGLRRDLDEPLTEIMARTIAGAVEAAHRGLRPAVLKAGRGSVDSVSQNRRDPAGPFDDALRVLLLDSPDPRDGAIAAIVNFACHPTVLFGTNMLISADYPGHAVRTVQQVVGDAPVVFLNGACGDVNPAWVEQCHDEARRVGTIVGAEAARRLQELRPLGNQHKVWTIRWDELSDKPVTSGTLVEPRVAVRSREVAVPLRRLYPPAWYDAKLAELEREREPAAALGAEPLRRVMEQVVRYRAERGVAERIRIGDEPRYAHPEVQAIRLGDGCAILGLPGEFFVETGRAIQAAAALPHLLVACYANHYVGYLVPRHAFTEGGYEPGVAMIDETAEETLRNAAVDLVRDVGA